MSQKIAILLLCLFFSCLGKKNSNEREPATTQTEFSKTHPQYKVAMLLLDFNNVKTSNVYLRDDAEKSMQHIHDYFYKMSRGSIDFNIDADQDQKPDIFVVPLSYNYHANNKGLSCEAKLRQQHINAINEKSDVSLYTHFIFVSSVSATPTTGQNTGVCGFTGKGLQVWPGKYEYARVRITDPHHDFPMIHELGHTLGLNHSNIYTEYYRDNYKDPADIMGNSYRFNHVNAPKALQLGIFRENPAAIVDVDESGTFTIENLSTRSVGMSKILNVGYYYFVSLRSQFEEDQDLPESATGIHVHQIQPYVEDYSYLRPLSSTQRTLRYKNDKFQIGRYTIELLEDLTLTSQTASVQVTVENPSTCDLDYNGDKRFTVADLIHLRKVEKGFAEKVEGKYYFKRIFEQVERLEPVLLKKQKLSKAMRWFGCDQVLPE